MRARLDYHSNQKQARKYHPRAPASCGREEKPYSDSCDSAGD